MPDNARAADVGAFAARALVVSVALGALSWVVRTPSGSYPMRDGMLLVAALSVILVASGFTWRRKGTFAVAALIGHLIFNAAATSILNRVATDAGAPQALLMMYSTFVLLYPLVVLVLFVGNRPQALWTRRQHAEETT